MYNNMFELISFLTLARFSRKTSFAYLRKVAFKNFPGQENTVEQTNY